MVQELQTAERLLLEALSGLEWATSQVSYNQARVARLTACISTVNSNKTYTVNLSKMPVLKNKISLPPSNT